MSEAPKKCVYCNGTDPNCGFCEMGKPLDTQADWDASWGKLREHAATFLAEKSQGDALSDRIGEGEPVTTEWPRVNAYQLSGARVSEAPGEFHIERAGNRWGCHAECGAFLRVGGRAVVFKPSRVGGSWIFHVGCFRRWWRAHWREFDYARPADRAEYLRRWRGRRKEESK